MIEKAAASDADLVFLDLGGTDRYFRRRPDGSVVPGEVAGDGRTWNLRKALGHRPPGPNVSIGRDLTAGVPGFLRPWPRRAAEPPVDASDSGR